MGAFDQKSISVSDPTPIGLVVQALGAPNSNYLQLSGQVISKSDYPLLAGVGGPFANDTFKFENSSFATTKIASSSGIDTYNTNRENQMGYANGKLWVVTSTGYCESSTDAITWTEAQITAAGGTVTVNGIIWCGGAINLYIAYGGTSTRGRQVWSSPDLVTWTNRVDEASGSLQFIHGGFDGTYGVLLSGAGAALTGGVYTSTNGTAWTGNTLPGTTNQNAATGYIKYFPSFGLWVAAHTESGGSANHIITTATNPSSTWTSRSTLASATYGPVKKLIQMGNRIFAFGAVDVSPSTDTTIRSSVNTAGTSWEVVQRAFNSETIYDAASNGQYTIICTGISGGFSAKIYKATNYGMFGFKDVTPTLLGVTTTAPYTRVIWTGAFWLVVNDVGKMFFSYDGDSWLFVDFGSTSVFNPMRQVITDGKGLVVGATNDTAVQTAIPAHNTSTQVYIPNRLNSGIPYFVRAK